MKMWKAGIDVTGSRVCQQFWGETEDLCHYPVMNFLDIYLQKNCHIYT